MYSTTLLHLIDFKMDRKTRSVDEYDKLILEEFERYFIKNG